MRTIRYIIAVIIIFILSLIFGDDCSDVKYHKSGHASYSPSLFCTIHSDIPHAEFEELLEWCEELHRE
jgi:hypothetical protein